MEALDSLALEQRLAPVRKGARVLREIAWRLREIGNDGRICDLIDSQVTVIEKGTDQFSSEEARAALRAAFAALQGRLVEFGDDDRAFVPAAETEAAAPSPAAPEMAGRRGDGRNSFRAQKLPKHRPLRRPRPPSRACGGGSRADANRKRRRLPRSRGRWKPRSRKRVPGSCRQNADAQDADAQDADAQDEAVLDMIAMEMGAPDPIGDDEIAEAVAEQARSSGACADRAGDRRKSARTGRRAGAAAGPTGGSTATAAPRRTGARRRRWKCRSARAIIASGMLRKPVTCGQRPAGADPAHEPGREDRVLLVKRPSAPPLEALQLPQRAHSICCICE